ncbi:GDSL-type esterase/lipase family protein [Actinoplanes sp. NPDC023936]|uniref:SGNH/GDSL hydrolase family protein n=1 Tax=Actinoplanes sp. NPDC023936 TaxID=3154910 RepID=UPI0033F03E38
MVALCLAAGGLVATTTSPASAATPHRYVAMGDSYSSGEGTYADNNRYDPGTTGDCHRSDLAWGRMLAGDSANGLQMSAHLACSGALTKHVMTAGHHGAEPQVNQLRKLNPRPELVTLTIGGNDAGFGKVAKDCYFWGGKKCSDALSDAGKAIDRLADCTDSREAGEGYTCLKDVYRAVKDQVPTGRVVVVGYPRLFATGREAYTRCWWANGLPGSLGKMNDLVIKMNKQILAQAGLARVEYVDVTDTMKGHELCTDPSWIRSITAPSGKWNTISAHPMKEGQTAIKKVVAGYLRDHPVVSVTPPATGPAPQPSNKPPVAAFTSGRLTGVGNRVTLDGSASSDPDGTVTSWTWTSGGRPIGTGRTLTTSFAGSAAPAVTLTVADNRGATAAATKVLSLPNRRPAISGVTPRDATVVPSTTPSFTVAATDPDGDTLTATFRVTGPSVDVSSGPAGLRWTVPAHRLDPGTRYRLEVTVRDPSGAVATAASTFTVAMLPTAADVTATSSGDGYWQVDTYGGVFSYGDAPFHGSLPGLGVRVTNIIGMARTPDDGGYWLVGSDGGVFAFGNAGFHGSMGGKPMNAPVVGMAVTPTGKGYWLAGADGGVFAFGDAGFFGSMGGKPLTKPVTAIGATADGGGYWLAAKDGGVFAFGNAGFHGSMGGKALNASVVDMDVTPDGGGYWMTAEDGGVFAFGNAGFHGSMAGRSLNGHITGMSVTPSAGGYWLVGCDGGIFAFGDAVFRGSKPTFQCRGT